MKNHRLVSLLTVLLNILLLSGCRFGNYTSPAAQATNTILELGTAPSSFDTIVIYNTTNPDGTNQMNSNTSTPLVGIPNSITSTFVNPVGLVIPVDTTQTPFFYNSSNQFSLQTTLTSPTVIGDEAASNSVTLWQNPNCTTQYQISQEGTINTSDTNTYVDATGANQTTYGRLSLTLTMIRTIQGDCQTDLQTLAACYQNSSSCPAATYAAAYALFNTWVQFGQVLTLDNATLAKIQGLAYIVQFE